MRDATCLQFRSRFKAELQEAASNGKLDPTVWEFVMALARMWRLDTQAVEGLNSTIKLLLKRAPHLAWPLLSARVTCRRHMVAHVDTDDALNALLDKCILHHGEAKEFSRTSGESRYNTCGDRSTDDGSGDDEERGEGSVTRAHVTKHERCAAKCILAFQRDLPFPGAKFAKKRIPLSATLVLCIDVIAPPGFLSEAHWSRFCPDMSQIYDAGFVWIPVHRFYNQVWLVQATHMSEGIALRSPFRVRTLMHVVSELHDLMVGTSFLAQAENLAVEVLITMMRVSWDLSLTRATIVDHDVWHLTLSDVCRCGAARRADVAQPSEPDFEHERELDLEAERCCQECREEHQDEKEDEGEDPAVGFAPED